MDYFLGVFYLLRLLFRESWHLLPQFTYVFTDYTHVRHYPRTSKSCPFLGRMFLWGHCYSICQPLFSIYNFILKIYSLILKYPFSFNLYFYIHSSLPWYTCYLGQLSQAIKDDGFIFKENCFKLILT